MTEDRDAQPVGGARTGTPAGADPVETPIERGPEGAERGERPGGPDSGAGSTSAPTGGGVTQPLQTRAGSAGGTGTGTGSTPGGPAPGARPGTRGPSAPPPARGGAAGSAADRRPSVPRPPAARNESRQAPPAKGGRGRKARLALRRIDPWSVFLFSFLLSLCLGVVLLVAVGALYAMLASLGVVDSINTLFGEVTGGGPDDAPAAPLLTAGRALSAAGILALVDVVAVTALATLGALLYNVCAALTGGIEVTLASKD